MNQSTKRNHATHLLMDEFYKSISTFPPVLMLDMQYEFSKCRAREMAQQLIALDALPEDPELILSTYIVTQNYLLL